MAAHKALLWEKLPGNSVRCNLCSHFCLISPGQYGICGVRENVKGELITHAYGGVIANNVDPIEKKPLFHFLPGTASYSIATAGCNFKCSFCQNWSISQTSAGDIYREGVLMPPRAIVKDAVDNKSRSISYTYTEPTVFLEYAMDIAKLAKDNGLRNIFVTNGFMTKDALDIISPYLDAANIDLKAFSNVFYEQICKARLEPVLDSIRYMKEKGIWIEITTLIVTGQNDTDEDIEPIASFISELDPDIPWHVSRFHPDYKYTDSVPTPVGRIRRAIEIGKSRGLKYIYPGNIDLPADTVCPGCGKVLIRRTSFHSEKTGSLSQEGECVYCGEEIQGIWS